MVTPTAIATAEHLREVWPGAYWYAPATDELSRLDPGQEPPKNASYVRLCDEGDAVTVTYEESHARLWVPMRDWPLSVRLAFAAYWWGVQANIGKAGV